MHGYRVWPLMYRIWVSYFIATRFSHNARSAPLQFLDMVSIPRVPQQLQVVSQ